MPHSAKLLIDRHEKEKNESQIWKPFYRDVNEFYRPRKSDVEGTRLPGTRSTRRHWHSAPIHSAQLLAKFFTFALTPSSVQWFDYRIPEGSRFFKFAEQENVKRWFRLASKTVFNSLQASNFYEAIQEDYLDFVTYATSNLYSEEVLSIKRAPGSVNFKILPIQAYQFFENQYGLVDSLSREFEISARQAIQTWGDKSPKAVVDSMVKEPDKKFKFLRWALPREEYDPSKQDNQNMPLAVVDIFMKDKTIITEGGFHEFPYHVGRYDKAAGEKRGRGPCDIAMNNTETLNGVRKMELEGLALSIRPPIVARDKTIIGNIHMVRDGITFVRGDPKDLGTFPPAVRQDMSTLEEEKLVSEIRAIFLTDQIVLPLTKVLTAEQVATMRNQAESILGPTVERIEKEKHGPMLIRMFGVHTRSGAIPPPPDELEGLDELDLEFIGPLAKSGKLREVDAINKIYVMGTDFEVSQPGTIRRLNLDKALVHSGPLLGVPEGIVRSDDEVKEIKEAEDQAALEAQQAQEALAITEGAKNIAPLAKVLQEGQKE